MRLVKCWNLSLALVLGGGAAALGQQGYLPAKTADATQPVRVVSAETLYVVMPDGRKIPAGTAIPAQYTEQPAPATTGVAPEAASRTEERQQETEGPPAEEKLGPTPPESVGILMGTGVGDFLKECGIRTYGWGDFGYTAASVGHGLLATETRENRFGDEFLVNQLAIVIEKPLDPKEFSLGFNVTYYGGADAALLQPKGGIDDPPDDPRFSHDFRQLFVSAHLPVLTEGGVDVKAGRMGTIIGYESALAPYRPFYSNDYQWFYSQDGAWTGVLTNVHVNKQLDVLNGMTLGANTFFTKRSDDSYCYIGQVNYWLQENKKTLLSASLHTGRDAIFATPGAWDTVIELRIEQAWSANFTQIIQSDDGWCSDAPAGGPTGSWYSLYTILIYHLNKCWDANTRIEWFDDDGGTVTGISTAYEEVTLGADYHPVKWLQLRPEVRGDFADERAFGAGGIPAHHSQLTAAIDMLLKF